MTSLRALPALLLALLIFPPALQAGGKKPDPTQISFHLQGESQEGPKLVFPVPIKGQQVFFRKSSVVNTKDIMAFRPFVAERGNGVTLQFNPPAARRLNGVTAQNQSRWLLAMFNGRPVDAVLINAPVTDGQLVIWEGIHLVEIQRMNHQWPFIGEDQKVWKKRVKEMKKKKN